MEISCVDGREAGVASSSSSSESRQLKTMREDELMEGARTYGVYMEKNEELRTDFGLGQSGESYPQQDRRRVAGEGDSTVRASPQLIFQTPIHTSRLRRIPPVWLS